MSYRRSLSFSESEKELLKYFDENGKSDIAKTAMEFYKSNKDKAIRDGVFEILNILKKQGNTLKEPDLKAKLQKLTK